MYRTFLEINGIVEDVKELNKKICDETGIEDFFDEGTDEWRAWTEYKDGKTVVLEETAD